MSRQSNLQDIGHGADGLASRPGVKRPMAIGFKTDEIRHTLSLPPA
jgi:hypothetical protein